MAALSPLAFALQPSAGYSRVVADCDAFMFGTFNRIPERPARCGLGSGSRLYFASGMAVTMRRVRRRVE